MPWADVASLLGGTMRKRVLFVQGAGKGAHEEDAELAAALEEGLGPDYELSYPLMPEEDSPDDKAWKRRIAEEVARLGAGAILVGHSAGGTILVTFVAESDAGEGVAGLFLIAAPFCGDGGWKVPGFELPPDPSNGFPGAMPVYLYHGSDDATVPFAHVDLYAKALPGALVRRLQGRNHQLDGDVSEVVADIRRLGHR